MPSDMEVELDVAPDPLQCVRSDAHDTGALYVHTILTHTTVRQPNTTTTTRLLLHTGSPVAGYTGFS